uniref:centrosomal protein of 85 kDa-like isoform X2 n=1 Tax=Myxine glutinosa TaxID=7769 RepID=UPI00358F82AA
MKITALMHFESFIPGRFTARRCHQGGTWYVCTEAGDRTPGMAGADGLSWTTPVVSQKVHGGNPALTSSAVQFALPTAHIIPSTCRPETNIGQHPIPVQFHPVSRPHSPFNQHTLEGRPSSRQRQQFLYPSPSQDTPTVISPPEPTPARFEPLVGNLSPVGQMVVQSGPVATQASLVTHQLMGFDHKSANQLYVPWPACMVDSDSRVGLPEHGVHLPLQKQHQISDVASTSHQLLDPVHLAAKDAMFRVKGNSWQEQEMLIERLKQQNAFLQAALCPHNYATNAYVLKVEGRNDHGPVWLPSEGYEFRFRDLERKLGAAEYETQQLKETATTTKAQHAAALQKMADKISNRDKHMASLKHKCQKEAAARQEQQKKAQNLERYLAGLPTVEEHQKISLQVSELKNEKESLKDTLRDYENKLNVSRQDCYQREDDLEDLRSKNADLANTVASLQQQVRYLEEMGSQPLSKIQQLQEEVLRLQERHKQASKLLDAHQKKAESKMEESTSTIKLLELRMAQGEEEIQALQEALARQDSDFQTMRSAMKELATQNQDLLEQKLNIQDRLQMETKRHGTDVNWERMAAELRQEMRQCLSDLQSLCSVLSQHFQGQDPNISQLLGIRTSLTLGVDENPTELENVESLAQGKESLRSMRRDLDELRALVCDRYAQSMAENCHLQ